jgi:Putative MetA-pathway of phenol degradation
MGMKRGKWFSFAIAALAISCVAPLHCAAQCPETPKDGIVANPNRPTVADPADITQYGVLEVEYGYDHVMGPQQERENNLSGLFKFAATCNFEIRWDTDTLQRQTVGGVTQTGFGDNALGFEYRFHRDSKHIPSLSIGYSLRFPSASVAKGLGTGKYDHEIRFYASKDILGTHFDFNTAYIFLGRQSSGGTDQFTQMNLAFSHPIYQKLQFTGEFYGNMRFNNGAPSFADGLWALTYAITPRLVVDSGIDHALSSGAPFHRRYFVGVTYSIADIYRAMRNR